MTRVKRVKLDTLSKIQPGYAGAEGAWGKIEVEAAVDKWASKHGLAVNVIRETCPTWWVVKP